MTFGNRKTETLSHSVIKHLIASILERQGHKVSVEYQISQGFKDSDIIDVFDHTDGLAYEVQNFRDTAYEKIKIEKYLKNTLVKDVIIIRTKDFPVTMSLSRLYKILQLRLGVIQK